MNCQEKKLDSSFDYSIMANVEILDGGVPSDKMEEKIYWGYLYDFYGELLNEHRRSIFESYVLEDLSLSEIADINSISRQAAHDVVKRSVKALEEYETKLGLLKKFLSIREDAEKISRLAVDIADSNLQKEISDISNRIIDEL